MREFKDSVTGIQDATKVETHSELPPPAPVAAAPVAAAPVAQAPAAPESTAPAPAASEAEHVS